MAKGDLAGAADALVDLVYIVHGTAQCHGLPWHALMADVHNANMRKVKVENAADSRFGFAHDIKKPEGWVGPRTEEILAFYGWAAK